jgi:hypothetical protein
MIAHPPVHYATGKNKCAADGDDVLQEILQYCTAWAALVGSCFSWG